VDTDDQRARRAYPMDLSIGDRLRRLRTERGLTQEELAAAADVSVDLVKKLEQGRRETARLASLAALANAVDVSLSELVGRRPRLDGAGDRVVLGLRDALLTPPPFSGIETVSAGSPTTLAKLWSAVRKGWRAYWTGEFVVLAQLLPGLIADGRATQAELGAPVAGPLAQAYQLTSCLLVHLGREDLAGVAAERGIVAAMSGDDQLQWATLHGTYSWTLLMQARHAEAEQLAINTANMIEPRFSTASPEHLTVWGGLVLWAMAAAVETGRGQAATDYISLAKVGSARLERDRHDYEVNFGPTQVAMQTTYVHATLGQPGKALAAAQGVRRADLYPISYGRHLLDVAQAHTDARQIDRAVEVLLEARDLAPVWFRHQAPARSLVSGLAERQTRLSPALRELVASVSIG